VVPGVAHAYTFGKPVRRVGPIQGASYNEWHIALGPDCRGRPARTARRLADRCGLFRAAFA